MPARSESLQAARQSIASRRVDAGVTHEVIGIRCAFRRQRACQSIVREQMAKKRIVERGRHHSHQVGFCFHRTRGIGRYSAQFGSCRCDRLVERTEAWRSLNVRHASVPPVRVECRSDACSRRTVRPPHLHSSRMFPEHRDSSRARSFGLRRCQSATASRTADGVSMWRPVCTSDITAAGLSTRR